MFDYQGPVHAALALAEFREDYANKLPAAQNENLRELNREASSVPKLLGGMEVLYVVALEAPMSTVAARTANLQILGLVARAVAEGQYGGAESRDRAWLLATWAAHQLDPVGPAPALPDVSPQYTTIVPLAPAPF